ncbi:MAG: sulfite exporter TauE/SafE family protein, partial [Myxococcales bacterium]|nr:sulfite exporter TauE/SafE family protein [Myxococcales bacterium]
GVLAHHDIPLDTAGILTASTIVGSLVGVRAGHSIKPDKLRRMFAMFVLVMAFAVLGKEIWSLTHHP